jgi:hypothetical protein
MQFPTLSRVALDVLPISASSVPCERLFSAGKEIADERRARLNPEIFEQLQMLKFHWRSSTADLAAWNSSQVEEVDLDEYKEMLEADETEATWDQCEGEICGVY